MTTPRVSRPWRTTGRKPCLSPAKQKALHEWAAFGRNPTEVARNLGVSVKTVRSYLAGRLKDPLRENG